VSNPSGYKATPIWRTSSSSPRTRPLNYQRMLTARAANRATVVSEMSD